MEAQLSDAHALSVDELRRLLAAVPESAGAQSSIDPATLRTFLLVVYGAGLRRGEARRLKIEDVDLAQALIHVRETKFFKSRIVPLGTSLNEAIRPFATKRRKWLADSDSTLFTKRDGTPLCDSTIGEVFKRLRTIAGIKREGDSRNQPRLHDLRQNAECRKMPSDNV